MAVVQSIDKAINLNGAVMSTKTTALDVTGKDRLTIDATLASGTWAAAELKLYASIDADGDNWELASPAITLDGAGRTWDVGISGYTYTRLQLTTAEGAAGTADIVTTAGVFDTNTWGFELDLNSVDDVTAIIDVEAYNTFVGILYATGIATAVLDIESSVDGIDWAALSPAIQWDADEEIHIIRVHTIRFLRVRVSTVEGSALTGQFNAIATIRITPIEDVCSIEWNSIGFETGWLGGIGYASPSYRLVGNRVELHGYQTHSGAWSFPEGLGTLPTGFRPGIKKILGMAIAGSSTTIAVGYLEIHTNGNITFVSAGSGNNGSGWISFDGLSFDI